jgi:uncharacterized protein (DUF2336 family)
LNFAEFRYCSRRAEVLRNLTDRICCGRIKHLTAKFSGSEKWDSEAGQLPALLMISVASAEFIAELEGAVEGGSPARRAQMLRQVTQLLLSSANRLDERLIGVFDDVLIRLIERVEAKTLVQLSTILSDLTSAPKQAVRRLACHEDATVAGPVLLKSETLSESDLIEIATHAGQQHLLAISGRKTLKEALTDLILKRGDTAVCRGLAKNAGARFSDQGYSKLVATAERDDDIADALVVRPDMPVGMIDELVAGATKAVRARLLKIAAPRMRETIQAAIESIAAQASAKPPGPVDYSEAKSSVLALSLAGKLSDSAVNRIAVHRQRTHVIAALSLLADAPIDIIAPLMEESDCCGLVVACRASRLNWQTTLAVINSRGHPPGLSQRELEQGRELFESLSLSVAQRTIRFGSVREFAKPGLPENDPAAARAS